MPCLSFYYLRYNKNASNVLRCGLLRNQPSQHLLARGVRALHALSPLTLSHPSKTSIIYFLYDKAHQGRALLSPRWLRQLTPLKSSCACEPTAHTPCEARSYNRLALYTCGAGAGSWAELPPCKGGKSLIQALYLRTLYAV